MYVFGNWTNERAKAPAVHFAERLIKGEPTACGRPVSIKLDVVKDVRLVTCKHCLKALASE